MAYHLRSSNPELDCCSVFSGVACSDSLVCSVTTVFPLIAILPCISPVCFNLFQSVSISDEKPVPSPLDMQCPWRNVFYSLPAANQLEELKQSKVCRAQQQTNSD